MRTTAQQFPPPSRHAPPGLARSPACVTRGSIYCPACGMPPRCVGCPVSKPRSTTNCKRCALIDCLIFDSRTIPPTLLSTYPLCQLAPLLLRRAFPGQPRAWPRTRPHSCRRSNQARGNDCRQALALRGVDDGVVKCGPHARQWGTYEAWTLKRSMAGVRH